MTACKLVAKWTACIRTFRFSKVELQCFQSPPHAVARQGCRLGATYFTMLTHLTCAKPCPQLPAWPKRTCNVPEVCTPPRTSDGDRLIALHIATLGHPRWCTMKVPLRPSKTPISANFRTLSRFGTGQTHCNSGKTCPDAAMSDAPTVMQCPGFTPVRNPPGRVSNATASARYL